MLSEKGWVLSPAFDLNPSDFDTQSLLISRNSNESSLQELLAAAGDYMLSTELASKIIDEVCATMRSWCSVARQCGISPSEQSRFAHRFDTHLTQLGL